VNRRKFLYSLSSLPAANLSIGMASSQRTNQDFCGRTESNTQPISKGPLHVGLLGIVGVGVYHLNWIAQSLNFPCKQIAIETDLGRLRWCHAEHTLLIGDHGFTPATIRDAQLMARDRKSDISELVSGLNVAFMVTGLNGAAGKGVTSVVAEALAEADVFTIAITPGRREMESVRSLQKQVDVVFEVPYDVFLGEAEASRRSNWRKLVSAAIAQICRVITFSLAQPGSTGIGAGVLPSIAMKPANPIAIAGTSAPKGCPCPP
jgi:hypothetical protein